MRLSLATALTLCLITACTPVEQAGEKILLKEFDCDEGPYAAAIPRDLAKLRKFAPLLSEKKLDTEDWGDYKATGRTLQFDGLTVSVVTFSNDRSYMLSGVKVTAPQWQVTGPLRVGMEASEFFSRIGKPRVGDGVWNLSQPGPTELFLTVKEGKIAVINYACYTG